MILGNDEVITDEVITDANDTNISEGVVETVTDGQVVENIEDASVTEQKPPKTFTQEEVDKIVAKRLARKEKEFEKKYSKAERIANIIKIGMGKENATEDELENDLKSFYQEQGIEIPEHKATLSERDEKILAIADAQEIIALGEEEMEDEANRLANIPNRTLREETMFREIASKLSLKKAERELEAKGINPEVIYQDDFKKFASKFNPTIPLTEIHDMYQKMNGKKIEKPASTGSVKSTAVNTVKDFYTYEESLQFTKQDFDRNPQLWDAVQKSMPKW